MKAQEDDDDTVFSKKASRRVAKVITSAEEEEGLGAMVRRSIGSSELEYLDPFLLLDEFRVLKPAGFPDHPHRGFETVTYMLSGAITHEDFLDHSSTLYPGDLQWMTAGRGIVHSQMPSSEEEAHGLQLWVNLPKADKMVAPQYQEIPSQDIPSVEQDGIRVKVIAGDCMGVKSSIVTQTPIAYLECKLQSGAKYRQPFCKGWNAFAYVLSGKAWFGYGNNAKLGSAHQTLILGDGEFVQVENKDSKTCHFVLIAGKPLQEHVFREGPFVMTSEEEIRQSIKDYRLGRNGFENALEWNSNVGLDYLDSQF